VSDDLKNASFEADGIEIARQLLPQCTLQRTRFDLLEVVRILTGQSYADLDTAWRDIRATDRAMGSLLYSAGKLAPAVHALAAHESVLGELSRFGLIAPAIVDVNFRVDSKGEEKFLFDWHQDYWFSVSSRKAVVAWIPLMDVDRSTGGVELISTRYTKGKIFKARRGERYDSYADGAILDEELPECTPMRETMRAGDVLFFSFDIMHRSLPVLSESRSRWTVQVRFADFADREFLQRSYRPASVSKDDTPYLRNEPIV